MDTAQNLKPAQWSTNTRDSYFHPTTLPRENWRAKEAGMDFDNNTEAANKEKAKRFNSSGFSMNSTLFDGTGWATE